MEESAASTDQSKKSNFAPMDDVTEELRSLYTNFQKCLDLRQKYMEISGQRIGDNPRDADDWTIYPPHPPPSWPPPPPESKGRVSDGPESVGSDFVLEDVPIPGLCDHFFDIDEMGIFQVTNYAERPIKNRKVFLNLPTNWIERLIGLICTNKKNRFTRTKRTWQTTNRSSRFRHQRNISRIWILSSL